MQKSAASYIFLRPLMARRNDMLNTLPLKSIGFWIAILVGIVGVLLGQGVIVEGSTLSEILGTILTIFGGGAAGHTIATNPAASD